MKYEDIKNALSLVQDPVEKLEMVMDFGKQCAELLGCASFVQICEKDGRFYGYADSLMVRGIVAIILAMIDGKSISEIKKIDFIGEFNNLNLRFGASRLNGIQSMINFFHNL